MELRHLRYFAAVAETLNFRLAAEALNLSTPALSKQVKDLEEEIGVRLLDRDTTQVRLTNAGAVFLDEVKAILAHATRAVQQAREAEKGKRGRLAIGNFGPLTSSYMSSALAIFCARYPEVEVDLIDVDMPAQVAAMKSGMIQLGFLPTREIHQVPDGFQSTSVFVASLCVAMAESHPLAGRGGLTLKELSTQRMLCAASPTKPSLHATYITGLFSARDLKPPRMIEVRGFESLLAMIAGGQGISILAGRNMLRVENLAVRTLKETGPDTQIDIMAIWPEGAAGVLAKNFATTFAELDHGRAAGAKKKAAERK